MKSFNLTEWALEHRAPGGIEMCNLPADRCAFKNEALKSVVHEAPDFYGTKLDRAGPE